jgi:uncharacterized delta-60 repeat protein
MARKLGRSRVRKFELLEPRWALNAADAVGGFQLGTSKSAQDIAIQGDLGTLVFRDGRVARYSDNDRLDTTFGASGFLNLGEAWTYGTGLTVDSSDRILVGTKYLDRDQEAVLLRYLPNGVLDTTFGTDGKVVFARPGILEHLGSLAPLPDGRLLVGLRGSGNSGSVYSLVRLDASGQIDPSFGEQGWFIGTPGEAFGATVSSSGEIYLGVGNDDSTRMSVRRLTSEGEIDRNYGEGGSAMIPFEGISAGLGSFTFDRQGGVLVQFVDMIRQIKVMRIDSRGVIDREFANEGVALYSPRESDYASPVGIAVQANGRILVGFSTTSGTATWPEPNPFYRGYLTRLTSEGDIDLTFGGQNSSNPWPAWTGVSLLEEFSLRADGGVVVSQITPERWTADNRGDVLRLLGDPVNTPPTSIELSGTLVPEDAQAGYVVGTLTALDNGPLTAGLAMLVDRTDLSVRIVNPTNRIHNFTTYILRSSSGQLSRLGWRSISDWVAEGPEAKAEAERILGVGHTHWIETLGSRRELAEGVDIYTGLEPGEEIELGKPLSSFPSDVSFAVIDSWDTNFGEVMWEPAPPTFELLDSAGGLFQLDGDRLVVADPSMLDFESVKQYTVRVRATDEGGLSYTQDLVVRLGNVNEVPTINAPAVWLAQPNAWLAMVGIVLDDPDLQGDDLNAQTLSLRISAEQGIVQLASVDGLTIRAGENGTAVLEIEGTLPALNAALATLSFRASPNFSGMALVNLRVDDQGNSGSGQPLATDAALRITVNSAPVASSDEFFVAFGGALSGGAVLGNDTDFDGDRLTALLVESPKHGTLQFAPDGSFNYTPSPGFAGRDSFRYRAVDGFFASEAIEVTLEVGAGDADLDGDVDLTDFGILKEHFGTGTTRAEGDFNGDGRVDLSDFGVLKAAFHTEADSTGSSRTKAFAAARLFTRNDRSR